MPVLVSERIGDLNHDGHRLEYTEYGSGTRVVVLLHGQLMSRRMHEPLARHLAGEGFHVYALDLLGHGRSDRPADPAYFSVTAFAEQVVALLDHLGAEQVVVGGTSMGANVALGIAVADPDRLRGLICEMPVLDNAVEAGIVAFGPLLLASRVVPFAVDALRRATRAVPRSMLPFWPGIVLDTLGQHPESMGATVHGLFFGRVAPPRPMRRRIRLPALIVGHSRDPVHPAADAAMLADELDGSRFVEAESILEWRYRPDRLDGEAVAFLRICWQEVGAGRTVRSAT